MDTTHIWTIEIKFSTGSSYSKFIGTVKEVKDEIEILSLTNEKREIASSETYHQYIDSASLEG